MGIYFLINVFTSFLSCSVETKKGFEGSELPLGVVLVVHTASVHYALSVEQLQIRSDENSVLLQRF